MDRRTVVKGASWAVPAITVAAMAPSLAASADEHMVIADCKYPGKSTKFPFGYRFIVTGGEPIVNMVDATLISVSDHPGGWEYVFGSSDSRANRIVTVSGKTFNVHFNPCNSTKE